MSLDVLRHSADLRLSHPPQKEGRLPSWRAVCSCRFLVMRPSREGRELPPLVDEGGRDIQPAMNLHRQDGFA